MLCLSESKKVDQASALTPLLTHVITIWFDMKIAGSAFLLPASALNKASPVGVSVNQSSGAQIDSDTVNVQQRRNNLRGRGDDGAKQQRDLSPEESKFISNHR